MHVSDWPVQHLDGRLADWSFCRRRWKNLLSDHISKICFTLVQKVETLIMQNYLFQNNIIRL